MVDSDGGFDSLNRVKFTIDLVFTLGVGDASKTPVTETKGNVGESGRADGVNGLREFTATSNSSFLYGGAASYSTVGERIFSWAATCKWP